MLCRFPKLGGTGGIWKAVSKLLPESKQRYNYTAVDLDISNRIVSFSDGSTIRYETLLSTIPLDTLLRWCNKSEWADGLQHSSSHIVGIGIRGKSPHGQKCWLYYPDDDCPFYRCVASGDHFKDVTVPEHCFCLFIASIL
jgi:protoporphyrinogen oxidase